MTSSPQYSTFLEHIIPRFLTFLQDGEVQFLQEKPAQVICSREECPAVGVPALVNENNSKRLGLPLKMREVLSDKGHFAHGHCLLRQLSWFYFPMAISLHTCRPVRVCGLRVVAEFTHVYMWGENSTPCLTPNSNLTLFSVPVTARSYLHPHLLFAPPPHTLTLIILKQPHLFFFL